MNKKPELDSSPIKSLVPLLFVVALVATIFMVIREPGSRPPSIESRAVVDKTNRLLRLDWNLIKSRFNKGDIDTLVARIDTKQLDVQLYGRDTGKHLPLVDCLDSICLTQADDKYVVPEYLHYSIAGTSQCGKDYNIYFRLRVAGPSGYELYKKLKAKANSENISLIESVGEYAKEPSDFSQNKYVGLPLMLVSDSTLRRILYPQEYYKMELEELKIRDKSKEVERYILSATNGGQANLKAFSDTLLDNVRKVSGDVLILNDVQLGVGDISDNHKRVDYFESSFSEGDTVGRFLKSEYVKNTFLCK